MKSKEVRVGARFETDHHFGEVIELYGGHMAKVKRWHKGRTWMVDTFWINLAYTDHRDSWWHWRVI